MSDLIRKEILKGINRLEGELTDLKHKLSKLDATPELSPWEDGTIYKLARAWVVNNPNERAVAVTQSEDGIVYIEVMRAFSRNWDYVDVQLGTFPEHPDGWRNSFTPLPPVVPVDLWPDDAESFAIDAHVQYMPPELNVYYKMYPRGLMEIWNFTRAEMGGQ